MAQLQAIADTLERDSHSNPLFHPPHGTLTIGQIQGGTAVNILAGRCAFVFDLRCPPGVDPGVVIAPFLDEVEIADRTIRQRFPETGIEVEQLARTPPLSPETGNAAELLARRIAGDNGPARAVSYAAKAGQFQEAGFSTIICGPGSIEQAHQPDEYIEVSQLERGAAFMLRLEEALRSG